ncbi:MAG: helicase-associated domain-containing protein, partial [Anaerolineaceae bacterium]|nr:helicase-associated domain-containing protein [Anaerolineaceae bacterium]
LEAEQWYRLDDLVSLIKTNKPDFLREQEEYFSWTVVSKPSLPEQTLLPFDFFEPVKEVETFNGFESWEQLEGKLISYILTVMLPLLGLADLALSFDEKNQILFRLKPIFFLFESSPEQLVSEIENEPIQLSSTGKIMMTNRSQRLARYQISRFAQWLEVSAESGTYQITPASLSNAEKQALLPKHLIQLLRKNAENGLPPQLYKAIKAWETEGKQAAIQTETILRLASPEILQALRDSKASHWLGESLGPTDVILKKGGEKAIAQALANLGYLTDINESENDNA